MNLLSAISLIIFTSFIIGAGHMLTACRKSVLNISAAAVLFTLGWWSFCNAFFFAAATAADAMFWHKLASVGWCGFVPLTAYYFLALTNSGRKIMSFRKHILFFLPPVILICKNLFGDTTSLAQNITASTSGLGWTYQNSAASPWLWIYTVYFVLYFSFAFYLLYKWSRSVKHRMKREMAILFIILDTITILCGVITDIVLPLTTPLMPALASVATAIFGLGYFGIIYRYDLFNIKVVISPEDILQASSNGVLVLDESGEILLASNAAGALFGYSKAALIGMNFDELVLNRDDFAPLGGAREVQNAEVALRCKSGARRDVLLSSSIARDKKGSFLCTVISAQDVSPLKKIQAELKLEREKYKNLAADYQALAYYDSLTALPNRRRFTDMLTEFEARFRENGEDFAVIFLDLDNFKHANDIYGHSGGDTLLIAAADKLLACAGEGEFAARLGGDEFMLIMPAAKPEDAEKKLERINAEFLRCISFGGQLYEIEISAGYALYSQYCDLDRLMQKADEAMYGDKNR